MRSTAQTPSRWWLVPLLAVVFTVPSVMPSEANAAEDENTYVFFAKGSDRQDQACVAAEAGSSFVCSAVDEDVWSQGVTLGDFNGDGYQDAVLATSDGPEQLCLGDGTANGFNCDDLIPGLDLGYTEDAAVGDVNADGNLDVVFSMAGAAERIATCLGDGAAGFSCSESGGTNLGGPKNGVALGYVNGDAHLDAVLAAQERNEVCLGDGSGSFTCSDISLDERWSQDVALGDVNGDGKLDAVFANRFHDFFPDGLSEVCLGNGSGGFSCSTVDDGDSSQGVALGDFDGDGNLDAVFATQWDDRMCLGDGTGEFTCSSMNGQRVSWDVAAADVNGDGHLDAVFATFDVQDLIAKDRICLGDGAGGFSCSDISSDTTTSLAVAAYAPPPTGEPDETCSFGDVAVVAARGSGESDTYWEGPGSDPDLVSSGRYGAAIYRDLASRLNPLGVSVDLVSVHYPAIPVELALIEPVKYGVSVIAGRVDAVSKIESIISTPGCSDVALVIVGYSQGAHVLQWALAELRGNATVTDRITAVGLFASPMFTHSDPAARGTFGRTATGVAGLPVLPADTQGLGSEYEQLGRTWCLEGDVVCDTTLGSLDDMIVHTGYLYGVSSDGRVLGTGSAASDVVNTTMWSLGRRGVIPADPEPGAVLNGPPTITAFAEWVDGNWYSNSIWVSAAPLTADNQPVTNYQWDLDGDGVFEVSGINPTIQFDASRYDRGDPGDTFVRFTVRVLGPARTSNQYAMCWDLKANRHCSRTASVGLVDPSQGLWHLYDGSGVQTTQFFFGNPGDVPIVGDWNCDGIETPGMYRQSDGYVYLRNSNTQGAADVKFFFGDPGDVPIAGDFNKDGCDTVSIYRPANQTFYIINELGKNDGGLGAAAFSYVFGDPGDKPFVGDFDGNGTETVGLHRESTGLVYFRNSHTQGNADAQFIFGDPDDRLIAGDWNGDGKYSSALFRPSSTTMFFRYTNTQGNADNQFIPNPSAASWLPVAGHFSG